MSGLIAHARPWESTSSMGVVAMVSRMSPPRRTRNARRAHRPHRQARGLTFVELLMAATIFSILLVGVSGHLRGTVMAWRRATSTVEQLQQTRVALDRLGEDLANAFVFEATETWTPLALFAAGQLQFYTVRQGRTGAEGDRGVRFVTYALEPEDEALSLVRTSRTAQEAAWDLPTPPQSLLRPIQSLSIRYAALMEVEGGQETSQLEWLTDWQDPTKLPKLVEVTVELGGSAAVPQRVRQVFVIPHGSLESPAGAG